CVEWRPSMAEWQRSAKGVRTAPYRLMPRANRCGGSYSNRTFDCFCRLAVAVLLRGGNRGGSIADLSIFVGGRLDGTAGLACRRSDGDANRSQWPGTCRGGNEQPGAYRVRHATAERTARPQFRVARRARQT